VNGAESTQQPARSGDGLTAVTGSWTVVLQAGASLCPMLLLLAAAAHATKSGSIPGDVYLAATGALVCWVVVYLVYKVVMTGRKDFGMPVKRRLLCKRLRVDHDQSAEGPIWWTALQVQRAVRAHWRHTLRLPFGTASEARPQL